MKRRDSGKQAIETHNIRQPRYPMPGTDLGETTAIPYNEAFDVDAPGGALSKELCSCGQIGTHHFDFDGHCPHMGSQTFVVERPREPIRMPSNPTRRK